VIQIVVENAGKARSVRDASHVGAARGALEQLDVPRSVSEKDCVFTLFLIDLLDILSNVDIFPSIMELGISRRNLTLALVALVLIYVLSFGRKALIEVGCSARPWRAWHS
jgi:hypothetical protein